MSDLAKQVKDLEKSFSELKSLMEKLLPSSNRRKRPYKDRAPASRWAQDVKGAINQFSKQLMQIRKAVNGGPKVGCSNEVMLKPGRRTVVRPLQDTDKTLCITSSQLRNGRRQLYKDPLPVTESIQHDESTMVDGESSVRHRGNRQGSTLDSSLTRHPSLKTHRRNTGQLLHAQSVNEQQHTESRRERANPEPVPLIQQDCGQGARPFSLSTEGMGKNLVANVVSFTGDPAFSDCISIKDIPEVDWLTLMKSIRPPAKDHDLFGVTYLATEAVLGAAELRLSGSKELHFPDFSRETNKPSLDECLDYVEQLIDNPPEGTIPYYVGPPLHDGPLMSMVNSLLHPGEHLLKLPPINGVNSVYWHAGEKGSGTAFHCEDMKLFSFNVVLRGWKLWIKIRRHHTAKFEEFIRKIRPANNCDQFVRHASVIVSPKRLQEEGIEFDAILVGPGDLVMTHPREYHMVVNVTENFALAINFLPQGEPTVPKDTRVCPQCGLYSLTHEDIRKVPYAPTAAAKTLCKPKRAAISGNVARATLALTSTGSSLGKRRSIGESLQDQTRTKKNRSSAPTLQLLDTIKDRILKFDKLCKFPALGGDLPSPAVFCAATAIWSRTAINQFQSLVLSMRDISKHSFRLDSHGDPSSRVVQRLRLIEAAERKSKLGTFQYRLHLMYLIEDWVSAREAACRTRADTASIDEILQKYGWDRKTLKRYHRLGNTWKGLCGGDQGLLCFILLEGNKGLGVTLETYTDMNAGDRAMFRQILDSNHQNYTKSLCSAGNAFLDALNRTAEDMDFRLESGNFDPYNVSEERLLKSLEQFPTITENEYVKDKYPDWRVPVEWPEQYRHKWPIDPTALLDASSRRCDLCMERSCSCISNYQRPMPRIKNYEGEGRGLQAVANGPGQIAYKKNEIIGELAGELVPLGTYQDGRTLELVRGDLPEEPRVCQIHCGNKGSIFRLLNHHCQPNTRFCGMTISGRYRMMVKAARDILNGDKMTVHYGSDFWGKQCPCDAHTNLELHE